MSQTTIWFERKFEFSFPVELYPNLTARLRGAPPRLEEVLRNRPHKTLITKPEEKWSAQSTPREYGSYSTRNSNRMNTL
jgi:hypothetical protein